MYVRRIKHNYVVKTTENLLAVLYDIRDEKAKSGGNNDETKDH